MTQTSFSRSQARSSQKFFIWFSIIFICIFAISLAKANKNDIVADKAHSSEPATAEQQKASPETKLAEQVYKNIQVFKGIPASELEPAMAFISGSLGVKCNHCHVNPFEKDDKPAKATARQMIRMVHDLNKGSFNGEKAVSCFTCHRGKSRPASIPVVGQNLWQPTPPAEKKNPLPTVDQVLDRYVQAVGGEQALRKVISRVANGSRIGADGIMVPEDVYQKAPNKILIVTSYPSMVFSSGFNGVTGWGSSSRGGAIDLPGPALAQLKNEAEFYREIKTKELYRNLTLVGTTTIGDREVYVIEATPLIGDPEKLHFDTQTGLLLRKYVESATVLGMFPLQTDYEDYREVDGVKQPFLIRWSMPGRSWGRKISVIKQNVEVDDARFNQPSSNP